uniref:Uncharacterized protein n=1 Tax=Spironucleus salmonicida TaxID=348837 RepID=V6LW15_9EUKA|eukprot:EST48755.1 Hypothetical protein SS50377_jh027 [Spironucleus salmonicida]
MNYIPKKTTTPLTQTLQLGDTGVYMPQQVDKYDQQSKRMQTLVSKLSKSQQVRTQSPQRMTLPQNSLVQKSLKNSPNVDFVPKKIGYVKVQQITSKIKEPPEEPHQQFQFCQNLDKYLVRQHKNSVDISLIKNDLKQTLDIDDCLDSNEENKDWIPNQIKQIQPNVAINTQKQVKGRFAGQLTHADSCQQNQLDIMQMAAQAASENLDGEQGTDINTLHETKHQPREANSRLAQAKNKDELDMEPSDANIEDAPPKSSAVTKSRYANHAQPDDDEDDEEPVSTPVHASQQKQEVPRGVRNLGLQHADSCQQNQMDIMRDAALASAREMDAQGAAGKNVKTTDLSNLGESSDISDIQLQTTEPQKLTQQRLKLNVPVFGETSSRFKNQQTVDDIQEEETASESDEAETYLPPQHLAKTNRNNLMLQHVDSYTQNQFEVFQIAQQIQNDSESFKNRKSALTNRENSNSAQQEAPKIAKRERLSRQLSHQDSCTQNQFEILSAASQILMDAELKSARGYKPNSIISHVGAEKVIPVRFGGSLQHMDSCTEDQRSILQMAEEIQSKEYNNESALSVRDFKYHDRKQNILVDSNAGLSALGTGIKPVQSGLLSQMLTQVGDSDQAFQRPEYLTDTGSFNLQREVLKCDGGFNK